MKLSKLAPYFFACTLFVFGACSDDENEDPTPIATDCKPTKVTGEDGTSTFTYENNRIVSFTQEEFGSMEVEYASNGRPVSISFEGGSIEYVYDDDNIGKLPDGLFMQSADMDEEAGEDVLGMFIQYEYNNAKRIIAAHRFVVLPAEEEGEDPLTVHMSSAEFVYDGAGNVKEEKEYLPNVNIPSATTTYTYDNKKNMGAEIQALLTGIFIAPPSPNNVLTCVMKNGNTVVKQESYTNTYEYNSGGYPTKITRTPQQGATSVSNIEYSCK